jgi:hypothetical protein
MLRVLRAEIQDLRDIFADIQSGATSIELQRTYLTNACATVDAAMKALDTTFLVQDDVFRHISNAWKRIRGYPLWQQPDTSAAAGDQVQKQIQTVEILDQQLRKMIMWIGYLTIPSRLETWLESTSPGYAIPFHAVFADEVPDADDRQKILSMLAMNACHMASVEVAYQVSATTHTEQDNLHRTIYVATEDYMPAYSLPYHDILTRLGAQPDMEAADLSRLIVERYCAFFRDAALGIPWGQDGWPVGVTLTAVDLAAVQRLALTVRSLSDALRADLDGQFNALSEAHIAAKTFDEDLHLYDLKSFCDALIEQQGAPATTLKAAKALSAALADASLCLARLHFASLCPARWAHHVLDAAGCRAAL